MKILILLFFVVACSHRVPTNRNEYHLISQDEFIISNIYVDPTEITREKTTLSFDYKIIVKNLSASPRIVNLHGAIIMIGLRTVPIFCRTHHKNEERFAIASRETIGIDCKVILNKQEGIFQISDYKSVIEIPLDTTKARFAYLLRAEDFK